MSSSNLGPMAFLSYVREDDKGSEGRLSEFRARLEQEVRMQTGDKTFRIFQDLQDIHAGEPWQRVIDSSLDQALFLIPIITPRFFKSAACRAEFERFRVREQRLGRDDLILPLYYVSSQVVEQPELRKNDPIAELISDRQYMDWRELRFESFSTKEAGQRLSILASRITSSLTTVAQPEASGVYESLSRSNEETPIRNYDWLTEAIGLEEIFPNFDACRDEILSEVTQSKAIDIFIQMGKSVLSGAAILYGALEQSRKDADIRILHSGSESPYLSEDMAATRESSHSEWREDINYANSIGARLQARLGERLKLRNHSEGYVFRVFLLDDYAYLQPYLYLRDNANMAPVLKFRRAGLHHKASEPNPNSLYHMLKTHFELKWEEHAPTPTRLSDMIPNEALTSVAALVEHSGRWVFVIPKRFIERDDIELPFHSIGGKCQQGETWIEALQREALEEIGIEVMIRSSAITRDITTSAEFEPIYLSDSPRPYCVYKRTRTLDPKFVEKDILWIVGYEAHLQSDVRIEPRSEIAAIVHLSPRLLRRIARETTTYEEIRTARDGSGMQVQPGLHFDFSRVAVPAGLAALPALRGHSGQRY